MKRTSLCAAPLAVLMSSSACTAILDFDPGDAQCWCGEKWQTQISGAATYSLFGVTQPIPATDTTSTACVSMIEHLVLDFSDPQSPTYVALRTSLESAAIANCELAGAEFWDDLFDHTDCSTAGTDPVTTNIVHQGACWQAANLEDGDCSQYPECGRLHDCTDPYIVVLDGGDETGGELAWECDEPVVGEGEVAATDIER